MIIVKLASRIRTSCQLTNHVLFPFTVKLPGQKNSLSKVKIVYELFPVENNNDMTFGKRTKFTLQPVLCIIQFGLRFSLFFRT